MTDDLTTVRRRLLMRALSREDADEAAELLEELRRLDPLSVETRGLELEYLILASQIDAAEKLAKQLVDQFPQSARIHYTTGRLAYQQRDYARAETLFAESYRIAPHKTSRRFLGKTLTQLGKFEQAESILTELLADNPACQLDLAWLYERKGQFERALRHVNTYLERHPDNKYATEQKARLEGSILEPDEFVEDLDGLLEHGEEVEDHLIPQYVENLFKTGQGDRARTFIAERQNALDKRVIARVAWTSYRLQVYDLAVDLFLSALNENLRQPKFLSALEAAATRCGRLSDLLSVYRDCVDEDPRFYGRMRRISKKLQEDES